MRTLFTIIITIMGLLTATSQDIIVKNDGETMNVYDLKVGKKFITYRLTPGGTSKRIGKAKVFSYQKKRSHSTTISDKKAAKTQKSVVEQPTDTTFIHIQTPVKPQKAEKHIGEIKRATADNNNLLIEKYSKAHNNYDGKLTKGTPAKYAVAIMGIAPESVLSNEDIEIEITEYRRTKRARMQYYIYIRNKSDKTLYVDLENSFRIFNSGTFEPYYKGKQIRQNKKSNETLSIEQQSTVYSPKFAEVRKKNTRSSKYRIENKKNTQQKVEEQKKVAIPPMGKLALPPKYFVDNNDEIIKRYDSFSTTINNLGRELHEWQTTEYNIAESPYKNSFIVTYSTEKKFTTYSTLKFTLYAKQLIGIPRKISKFRSEKIDGYDKYTIYGEAHIKQKQ